MWSRAFRLGASHQRLLARGAAAAAVTCAVHHHHRTSLDRADCLSWPFGSSQSEQQAAPKGKRSAGKSEPVVGGYSLGKTLGEGAFAVVKLATHVKSGLQYACKLVQKSNSDEKMLQREVDILEAAGRHKNIVSLIDRFDAPEYDSWALIFDLVSGGEVFERICDEGNYSEREAAKVVRQITLALQHLHHSGIVHRDLKPENLLLASHEAYADVKLADFGLAGFFGEGAPPLTGRKGTVAYMAPEVFRGEAYGAEVDLWALGVIMFILLAGYHPFDPDGSADDSVLERRVRLMDWGFKGPEWKPISREAKSLIRRLLDTDPAKRAGVSDVLASPWVGGEAAPATPLPASTASRLRDFNEARRLWRAAIRATALIGRSPAASEAMSGRRISREGIAPEALEELRTAFKAYDTDGNGTIDLQELKSVMCAAAPRSQPPPATSRLRPPPARDG